jgi:aryl sulfotransferase
VWGEPTGTIATTGTAAPGSTSDAPSAAEAGAAAVETPRRTRTYRSHHLDSGRWDHLTLRPGDIVIATSMKAGTTWMQRIVSLLVFGAGPLPASLMTLSPWIDSTLQGDVQSIVATLDAQQHRRFLKTHLPLDALPYDPAVRYVYVGRDTRDVFMSAFNHYSGYTELVYALLDVAGGELGPMPRCPATERELWAEWMTRSWFDWETDGWPFWSHHHHAASFWRYRDLPNVLMVHYADLLSDLEGEMRCVASFTEIEVADDAWPELVAAARFDAMKQEAIRNGEFAASFEGGAARFFHKGTNGRWRDVLTERDLALYEAAAAKLEPSLRAWLESGSPR